MRTRLLATTFLLALLLPGRGSSDPPSPPAKRSMSELVAALGAEDPKARDAAKREIVDRVWEWAPDDVQKMEAATHSKDTEVAVVAAPILQTIRRRQTLAKAMEPVKDWDKGAVLDGDSKTRANLVKAVFEAWISGRVPDDAWSAVSDLALEESWIRVDTGALIVSFARKNATSPLCRNQIIRLCDAEDSGTASIAANAAARLDIREALPAICRAIGRVDPNEDFGMLRTAAAILGVANDGASMKQLAESVPSHVREACAWIIEREFATERGDLLPKLLADPDPFVKRQAFCAMCSLGKPEHLDLVINFLTHEDLSKFSCRNLGKFRGKFDAEVLAGMAESNSPDARRAAASLLAFATGAQTLLERGMHDPDAGVRQASAYSTGYAGDLKAVPELIGLLADDSVTVRTAAAISLGRLKAAEAVSALRQLVKARKPKGSVPGLVEMATLGDARTVSDILDATADGAFPEDPDDQLEACEALGLIGGPEALSRLRALKGGEYPVRWKLLILAKDGEPQDRQMLDTPIEGMSSVDWLIEREHLAESLGVMQQDLPAYLRGEKQIKPGGAFAANARFATKEQATDELIGLLEAASRLNDGCEDNALVALVALGKTPIDQQRQVLRRVRAMGDSELFLALCEALTKAHEPAAWEAWTREAPVDKEVRFMADAVALMASRGIEFASSGQAFFRGRIAKGHIISLRRIRNRIGIEGYPAFSGQKLSLMPAPEALRWWSDRLDR